MRRFSMRRFSSAIAVQAVRGRPAVRSGAPLASSASSRATTLAAGAKKPAVRATAASAGLSDKQVEKPASPAPPGAVDANEAPVRSVPSLARPSDGTPTLDDNMVQSVETLESELNAPDALDWGSSFQGLGSAPFSERASDTLLAPVNPADVEITPDGLIYLPEIKYRRILNRAFGPGGWGIAPRTKTMVTRRQVTREYGLVCMGRLVSISRGEMDFFSPDGVTTAMEGCKSNALMRCCKDLGIASELWDPAFIRDFKTKYCDTKYFEKKKRFAWKRKDRQWEYPYV